MFILSPFLLIFLQLLYVMNPNKFRSCEVRIFAGLNILLLTKVLAIRMVYAF